VRPQHLTARNVSSTLETSHRAGAVVDDGMSAMWSRACVQGAAITDRNRCIADPGGAVLRGSRGSAASIRRLDERTLDGSLMPAGISRSWATGSGISSSRTDVRLRPLYPETGHWRRDFLAARTTGCGRLRPTGLASATTASAAKRPSTLTGRRSATGSRAEVDEVCFRPQKRTVARGCWASSEGGDTRPSLFMRCATSTASQRRQRIER
jgi:hypothetical protein